MVAVLTAATSIPDTAPVPVGISYLQQSEIQHTRLHRPEPNVLVYPLLHGRGH